MNTQGHVCMYIQSNQKLSNKKKRHFKYTSPKGPQGARDRPLDSRDESVLVTVMLLVQVAKEYLLNDRIPKDFHGWRTSSSISAPNWKLSPSSSIASF